MLRIVGLLLPAVKEILLAFLHFLQINPTRWAGAAGSRGAGGAAPRRPPRARRPPGRRPGAGLSFDNPVPVWHHNASVALALEGKPRPGFREPLPAGPRRRGREL